MRNLLLVLAAGAACAQVHADSTFKYSGSVRARYEALSGQSRAGFKGDDQLLSLRTLVAAEYDTGLVRIGGELADSRAFLADPASAVSSNDVDALEPAQLYLGLDLDQPFGKDSALGAQAGRMQLNIGSRRLVSSDDYRNVGNSVDGVRIDGKRLGWSGTLFYVLPVLRLPDDIESVLDNDIALDRAGRHAVLWGALATSPRKLAGGALDLQFVKFRESDAPGRPTRDRNLDTWALRWYRDAAAGEWDYEFEAMRQGGRARTGTAAAAALRDVEASFYHARVGYQWDLPWKPRLALEYDRASGDSGADKIRRFDTLLGGRRFELAPSGLYNQVGRANFSAPGLRLELTPGARMDLMGTWKQLYLASRTDAFSTTGVRDASGRAGRNAGQQLDVRVRYWVVPKRLRFEWDGVLLIKGRFLDEAPNARPGDTRFSSLNVTYTF